MTFYKLIRFAKYFKKILIQNVKTYRMTGNNVKKKKQTIQFKNTSSCWSSRTVNLKLLLASSKLENKTKGDPEAEAETCRLLSVGQ